jgi:hypothetical protein
MCKTSFGKFGRGIGFCAALYHHIVTDLHARMATPNTAKRVHEAQVHTALMCLRDGPMAR